MTQFDNYGDLDEFGPDLGETRLLSLHSDDMIGAVNDPSQPPRPPTGEEEGIIRDGQPRDLMGDTPPADVLDVNPAIEPGVLSLEPDLPDL